jgi:hypothetical protein
MKPSEQADAALIAGSLPDQVSPFARFLADWMAEIERGS